MVCRLCVLVYVRVCLCVHSVYCVCVFSYFIVWCCICCCFVGACVWCFLCVLDVLLCVCDLLRGVVWSAFFVLECVCFSQTNLFGGMHILRIRRPRQCVWQESNDDVEPKIGCNVWGPSCPPAPKCVCVFCMCVLIVFECGMLYGLLSWYVLVCFVGYILCRVVWFVIVVVL